MDYCKEVQAQCLTALRSVVDKMNKGEILTDLNTNQNTVTSIIERVQKLNVGSSASVEEFDRDLDALLGFNRPNIEQR